ncbi:MAG TPA: TIGR02391 family protein [Candidatus Dormibacteraeota bacterium]|jgi:uncharacterized protein (TIGR02391 family)|nr:TIGR02391 family protein [Candidatus Dormibacteraeota bacterium]
MSVDDLDEYEDRVLYYLVDLAGPTPLALNEFVREAAIAERAPLPLAQPGSAGATSDPRGVLLTVLGDLESHGYAKLHKVMGPWGAQPTRHGRDRVAEWRREWQANRDRLIQDAILADLDGQRRANPARHTIDAQIDIDNLCAQLGVDRNEYLAAAQGLRDQGKISEKDFDATLEQGHAYITERGVAALSGTRTPSPSAELERAWNEVARLQRELNTVKSTPADLIKDPELLRRCSDLLGAPGDYDRVMREASTILEDRIRVATGATASSAVPLMRLAFDVDKGPLRVSTERSEQEAAAHLFAGTMGLFRNQSGHQLVHVSYEDAVRYVVMVDLLLSLVARVSQPSATAPTT